MSDFLDVDNEELLKDYFSEAEMMIENLESNILAIENDPNNHDAIDEIFRAAHTLKGNSAAVEFSEISTFAHTMEDLLDEIRSDRVKVSEHVIDVLLTALDVIKAMMESRKSGSIYGENTDEISDRLRSFIGGGKGKAAAPQAAAPAQEAPAPAPAAASHAPAAAVTKVDLNEFELLELKQGCAGGQKLWGVYIDFDENNPMNTVGGIQVFAALKAVGTVLKTTPDFDALYEDEFHKSVVYFVASSSSQEEIEDVAFLDDVTLSVDARDLTNAVAADSDSAPASPAPAAAAPEPVAAAPQPAAPAPARSVHENARRTSASGRFLPPDGTTAPPYR